MLWALSTGPAACRAARFSGQGSRKSFGEDRLDSDSMNKVLVTGAGGYLGSHVVGALADRGIAVVAVQRRPGHADPRAETLVCDFASLDAQRLAELGPIDRVIHLAWTDGFSHNAASHIDNLPVHVRFAQAVAAAGVRQFVGMGSMHEIGYWEGAINDRTPTAPRSLYGIAKNALREAARLATEQANGTFLWLRAYYILGDDLRNQSLFSKILGWEAEGKATFPLNSGKNRYDFIDVRDLAEQVANAALQSEVAGIVECCTGRPVSLRDQVERFIAEHGLAIRPEYGAFPERPYDSPGVWGDPSRINAIIASARAAVASE